MKPLAGRPSGTRRSFLRTSLAVGGTATLGSLALQSRIHAAGSDVIRIGLIGCGGRGTEAARNAMNAGKDIRLVALADLFDERLQASRAQLQKSKPDQFDHQAVVFEYDNGVRVFGFTRDQADCYRDTNDYIFGTKGRCNLLGYRIEGETNWHYDKPRQNMYDVEHAELFASIRAGKPIHNGSYMCLSSALGIAAQIACYTGATLKWEDVMNSKRFFALPRYGWDVEPPVKPGPDGRYPTVMQGKAEYEKWRI